MLPCAEHDDGHPAGNDDAQRRNGEPAGPAVAGASPCTAAFPPAPPGPGSALPRAGSGRGGIS